jgi:hypothetical protein
MRDWIVVNADDLGVSHGTTFGIIEAHRRGVVTSASLAVTTASYGHAVNECVRKCPDLGIGLHFTLTSGRPVRATSLLANDEGYFRWRFTSLLAAVAGRRGADLIEHLRLELDAQLSRLESDGIRPDHIDSERHVHLIPGIFELVVAAARARGIPFVRAGVDSGMRRFPVRHIPGLALRGGIIKSRLLSALSRRAGRHMTGLHSAGRVVSYFGTGRMHLSLRDVPSHPDGTELMVHPGLDQPGEWIDVGNGALESYLRSPDRQRELQFCDRSRLTNFRQLAAAGPRP